MSTVSFNRRSFLATAGSALLASSYSRVLGANERLNVGVIGVGGRGTHIMKLALKRAEQKRDVQVVAVCDVYNKRAQKAAELAGNARQYVYHNELLDKEKLDAVMIATPDHWHAPITLAAFDKGLDVYCEKPVTHTVEEAITVADRAAKLGRVLQVGVQSTSWTRWHNIRDIVASGTLGKVVVCHGTYSRNVPEGDWNWDIDPAAGPDGKGENHVEWKQWLGSAPERPWNADRFFRFRKYWDYSGGIATDLHYHTVAPFQIAIANDFPTRVAGMGGIWVHNDGREVPDTFMNSADYPGKYSIVVQSSQANAHGPATMIRGEHATLLMGEDWEGRDMKEIRIVAEKPFRKDFIQKHGTEEIVMADPGNDGDQKHVDNFFDCVRSRQQPNCPADLALKVMVNIGLSVESYRQGKMFYFDAERRRVSAGPIA